MVFPIINTKLDQSQLNWLKSVFLETADSSAIPSIQAIHLFDRLKDQYQQPKRAYHNLSHIYSMLQFAKEANVFSSELYWAIWYHDYIYEVPGRNNEELSGVYAKETLRAYNSKSKLEKINQYIISTKNHSPLVQDEENKLLIDFDLAILAAPRPTYEKYCSAIRKEYQIYPNFMYTTGRKKTMIQFLKKDQIYYSSLFKEKWEVSARENIQWEIDQL